MIKTMINMLFYYKNKAIKTY